MIRRLLVWLIVAELAGGAYYLFGLPPRFVAPVPDLTAAHPLTAAQFRAMVAALRTPDDWAALGEMYLAMGYFSEAEACARVASARSPTSAQRMAEWAFALEGIGDLPGSNAAYERAVSLGHTDPGGCWYSVGRNHLRTEDLAAARAAFERAGNQPSARYELSRLAVLKGSPADAIPVLDRLIAEYPGAVQPPLLRHKIEALAGSPRAAEFADRATRSRGRLPSPFADDWERLNAALNRMDPFREIREIDSMLRRNEVTEAEPRLAALKQFGFDPRVADQFAEAAFRSGRLADAVPILREAIDRDGPSVQFLARLGSAYSESGNSAEAVAAWERATALGVGAETKNVWHELATHYEKAGQTAAAGRAHGRAFLGAGHELFWEANPAAARPAFAEAVKHDPDLAAAWFYLGECERVLGSAAAARTAYTRCLEVDPNFGRAHTAMSLLPPPG